MLIVSCSLFGGCITDESRKEAMINNVISLHDEVSAEHGTPQQFQSVDVRREGDNGIVFEYIHQPEILLDKSQFTDQVVRKGVVTDYKKSGAWNELEEMFDLGIYFRFINKNADGSILADTRLDQSHLDSLKTDTDQGEQQPDSE